MYLKVYISNKPLYLCDALDNRMKALLHKPDTVLIDELNAHTVRSMFRELNLPEINTGIFVHPDLEALKSAIFRKFQLIQAGGGVVRNPKDELLMIFRRGTWDLPKGKLDDGETLEECALREVREETGLEKLLLIKPLTITRHTYALGTHQILKETHWFLMKHKDPEVLRPQTSEDITDIKWVSPAALARYKRDTFPSIRDVLDSVQ